jgi:hypothetical protein
MKTPIAKATPAPANGGPPFGPIEEAPEWLAAHEVFLAARAAEDEARTRFQQLEKIRRTSTDKVAVARARLAAVEAEAAWVEAHATREQAEREREAVRQRVIAKRRVPWENAYATELKALADALRVAAEVNDRAAAVYHQAQAEGVKLDPYFWPELQAAGQAAPGAGYVYTKIQAWTDALNKAGWFEIR